MGEASTQNEAEIGQDEIDGDDDLSRSPLSSGSLFANEVSRSQASHRPLDGQAVLVVARDGTVSEVLQAPEAVADGLVLEGKCIDDVWPGEPTGRLARIVDRAIRSRSVQSSDFSTGDGAVHLDFVFIPHGRDRAMVVARDVSARQSHFHQLEELAYIDDTTKLPNRQFLFEELTRCVDILRLHEGRGAVICLDVDWAESDRGVLNAKHNDAVFVEIASRLTHELRGANQLDSDDYERYTVAARVEYGKFAVVLPVIDSGEDAEGVALRLIETMKRPVEVARRAVKPKVHGGIALFPQDGTDADTLFNNAMAAMDDASNNQSTGYKFHSGTVKLRALQRQDLELELRAALDRDEFAVEFLPIVAASTRSVVSVEALLRWPQNVFGAQSIRKVISLAENTGLILPIGDWVLRKGCAVLSEWRSSGWPKLRVAVNLSVQEFSRDDLAERITTIVRQSGMDPSAVDIEITEYSLFRDAMQGYEMCRSLKKQGLRIVVDDYGTGACSLAHVARSPVDAIKIDNSFVAAATTDDVERAACAAMVAMAHQLGIQVIAEGVETSDHAELLTELGCDQLQGFGICRPTDPEGIAEFLGHSQTKDSTA